MKKGVDSVSSVWSSRPARKVTATPAPAPPPAARETARAAEVGDRSVRPAAERTERTERTSLARKKAVQREVVSRKPQTARAKSVKPAR